MTAVPRPPRVAYLLSRFPKLSETFVIMEIVALRRQGFDIRIYPFIEERGAVAHAEVPALMEAVRRIPPPAALRVLLAQLQWAASRPRAYLGVWVTVVRELWRSPGQLARAALTVPRSAWFARDMRRNGVEHIHAHFANHPAAGALVIGRLSGIPYSFTAHAHDLFVDRSMLCAKIDESAFTVTISEYNRRLMLRECPRADEKVHVIHCGVETSLFAPAERPIRSSEPVGLVCIGTLEPKKGQSHLVEACALLRDRGVRVTCTLIGDGPDRESLDGLIAARDVGNVVRIAGALPRSEVARALASADIAVLPSIQLPSGRMEGIPVSLMEAMASGLPVVSTRISGIPELVEDGDNGLLVEPGDAAALADALQSLAEDRDLRGAMGQRGRRTVQEGFDLDRCAAQLAAAVTEAASR